LETKLGGAANCRRNSLDFSVSAARVVQVEPREAANDPRDFVFGDLRPVADHNRDQAMAVALGAERIFDLAQYVL